MALWNFVFPLPPVQTIYLSIILRATLTAAARFLCSSFPYVFLLISTVWLSLGKTVRRVQRPTQFVWTACRSTLMKRKNPKHTWWVDGRRDHIRGKEKERPLAEACTIAATHIHTLQVICHRASSFHI